MNLHVRADSYHSSREDGARGGRSMCGSRWSESTQILENLIFQAGVGKPRDPPLQSKILKRKGSGIYYTIN